MDSWRSWSCKNEFRETNKKKLAIERLRNEQQGDTLVVAAQFGFRYRGFSLRKARAIMGGTEFGLGTFEISIMLLTHPERLQQYHDLFIDCAGDECAGDEFEADGHAPYFELYAHSLKFACSCSDNADDHYGSPSAFSRF